MVYLYSKVTQFWGLGAQNQRVGRTPPSEICSRIPPFLLEAPGGWLAILLFVWQWPDSSLCPCLHMAFPLCPSIFTQPACEGPNLLQYDHILTVYNDNDAISKEGHVLRYWD